MVRLKILAKPRRVFLDTSVINFIVEHSDSIFNGSDIDEKSDDSAFDDIRAMARIYNYAGHNAIEMIISKTTFDEIAATTDSIKGQKLERYCTELWSYFIS